MNDGRRQWIGLAVVVGITYAVIGVVFAWPATHVRAWRLAAWLVSAALFAGHIAYERLGLGTPSRRAAMHVAVAVAIGAFGLAVGAVVHSLLVESSSAHHRLVLIALVVWPVITGVPAFLVAFVAGEVRLEAQRHERLPSGTNGAPTRSGHLLDDVPVARRYPPPGRRR